MKADWKTELKKLKHVIEMLLRQQFNEKICLQESDCVASHFQFENHKQFPLNLSRF